MGNPFYVAAAIAIGVCLSLQPPINAAMARTLGSPMLAASTSIAISLVLMIAVWLSLGGGDGDLAQAKALPWWVVLGGMVGVVFVAGSLVVAPVLGVTSFFVFVIAGQLLGSTFADQLGAFGMQVKPISALKLVGLALVLAGAVLVENSNG